MQQVYIESVRGPEGPYRLLSDEVLCATGGRLANLIPLRVCTPRAPPQPVQTDATSQSTADAQDTVSTSSSSSSTQSQSHSSWIPSFLRWPRSSQQKSLTTRDGLIKSQRKLPTSTNRLLICNVASDLIVYECPGFRDPTSVLAQTPLRQISFSDSMPTSLDVFAQTLANESQFDMVVGLKSGELVLRNTLGTTVAKRVNTDECISKHPVSFVRWVPRSESQFLAAHMDGSLILYDKNLQDPATTSSNSSNPAPAGSKHCNPVSQLSLCKCPIHEFKFSPSGQHLASASRDGILRIVEFETKTIVAAFHSYFGALLCLDWSPDGKYIATGGEDDFVSIWSVERKALVAHCAGHSSYVSSVQFDKFACHKGCYRVVSVGQDTQLGFWEFSETDLKDFKVPPGNNNDILRPSPSRESVLQLDALAIQPAHTSPITAVACFAHEIITATHNGEVKAWRRPVS